MKPATKKKARMPVNKPIIRKRLKGMSNIAFQEKMKWIFSAPRRTNGKSIVYCSRLPVPTKNTNLRPRNSNTHLKSASRVYPWMWMVVACMIGVVRAHEFRIHSLCSHESAFRRALSSVYFLFSWARCSAQDILGNHFSLPVPTDRKHVHFVHASLIKSGTLKRPTLSIAKYSKWNSISRN